MGTQQVINLSNIPQSLYDEYPSFGPLLEYILNPIEEADIHRRKFFKYVTGTQYSPSEILILLTNSKISSNLHEGQPFFPHTCFSQLDLYKKPDNSNVVMTIDDINRAFIETSNLSTEE